MLWVFFFLLFKKEPRATPEVLEENVSLVAAPGSSTVTPGGCCSPGGCTEPEADGSPLPTLAANGCPRQHPAGEPQLQEKLQQLQLGRGPAPPAPSCLLTPPTTPLNFDSASPESPQGTGKALQDPRRNGMNGTKSSTPEGTEGWCCPWGGAGGGTEPMRPPLLPFSCTHTVFRGIFGAWSGQGGTSSISACTCPSREPALGLPRVGFDGVLGGGRSYKAESGGWQSDNNPVSPLPGCSPTPYDYPTPESSSRSSATDDFCYVFVVELERGPLGLGMGLIDGLVSSCRPRDGATALQRAALEHVGGNGSHLEGGDGFARSQGAFIGENEARSNIQWIPAAALPRARSITAVLQLARAKSSVLLWKGNDSGEVFPMPFSLWRSKHGGGLPCLCRRGPGAHGVPSSAPSATVLAAPPPSGTQSGLAQWSILLRRPFTAVCLLVSRKQGVTEPWDSRERTAPSPAPG